MNAKVSSRPRRGVRWAAVVAGLCALCLAFPASAGELLEVVLDPDRAGALRVGLRNAGGAVPQVAVGELPVPVVVEDPRTPSIQWQPLFVIIDTSNIEEGRLDKIRRSVSGLATRELKGGSRGVSVFDQKGAGAQLSKVESVESVLKVTLDSFKVVPNPDPSGKKPSYSTISALLAPGLQKPLERPIPKPMPWALIFSSLCVAPEDDAAKDLESLKGFKGPIRFLTWDTDLHPKCAENRAAWLASLRTIRPDIEVLDIDSQEQAAAIETALKGRTDVVDEVVTMTGVPYEGGLLDIEVTLEGQPPWVNQYVPYDKGASGEVPHAWFVAAKTAAQRQTRIMLASAFGGLVVILIGLALFKARSGGVEVAKWEAVGEAEDLATSMDPDAWNATIFQLTGAMPALKEVRQAAQLGPADAVAAPKPAPAPPPAGAADTSSAPALKGSDMVPTGMTVAMPVLDDGTTYDAEFPFEVGVLLNGKPVARKTKKFRKVFSIGRATDNRVVIQKDDTVHRYHVVVRPALQGKEWWLEVSPTSTNRTNLNGKDLRAGGRYRLPARFRLQLGEATEIRGRLAKEGE